MIYLFLSVVAICATAIAGYRMHLASRPAVTPAEYDKLLDEVKKLTGRLDKLNMAARA